MKYLLLVLAIAANAGRISVAQTHLFIPCAQAYYEEVCTVEDEDQIADWITNQLDALIECNGAQTAEFAIGLASICARDPDIGVYCGVAQYYVPDILGYLMTDCADAVANDSVDCSPECAAELLSIRNSIGCCINTLFNITGPDQFANVEEAFTYSLWTRCNVPAITHSCTGSQVNYEVMDGISEDCTPQVQANNVAAAFCVEEERILRLAALADENLECENFHTYLDSYCTRDPTSNRYCLTRDGAADFANFITPITQHCQSDTSCSPECRRLLSEFQDDLGCCLNVVYNDTSRILGLDTFPLENDSLFRLCGLSSPVATCSVGGHAQGLTAYGLTVMLLLLIIHL